jgi:hypothetical protein
MPPQLSNVEFDHRAGREIPRDVCLNYAMMCLPPGILAIIAFQEKGHRFRFPFTWPLQQSWNYKRH